MKTIWAVVADEAIARIVTWPETGDEVEAVEELTDPDAHARTAELRRDAYGRRSGGAPAGGTGSRVSSATSSASDDEKHQNAGLFARRVAEHLAQALRQQRYGELRIAAAPRFLGLLRKALSAQVAATVSHTVDKDYVHMDHREITTRLFPHGRGPVLQ